MVWPAREKTSTAPTAGALHGTPTLQTGMMGARVTIPCRPLASASATSSTFTFLVCLRRLVCSGSEQVAEAILKPADHRSGVLGVVGQVRVGVQAGRDRGVPELP